MAAPLRLFVRWIMLLPLFLAAAGCDRGPTTAQVEVARRDAIRRLDEDRAQLVRVRARWTAADNLERELTQGLALHGGEQPQDADAVRAALGSAATDQNAAERVLAGATQNVQAMGNRLTRARFNALGAELVQVHKDLETRVKALDAALDSINATLGRHAESLRAASQVSEDAARQAGQLAEADFKKDWNCGEDHDHKKGHAPEATRQ
ncbi:MAG: hypothetical protein HY904_06410 [Deltaproteobacteria bacterium]|nr:hypothetical protein [Deltaproteobacteria bacterium]